MKRVLVTGASGFVGRPAVSALRRRGYEVHGVARKRADDVEVDVWHLVDLLEPLAAGEVMRTASPSHLLHLAWTTEHGNFWSDRANVAWRRATRALVEDFVEGGGERAVMSGSCAQYDWASATSGVFPESAGRRPQTLYGLEKQTTADFLDSWSAETGVSYATGLLFFPYGPFDNPKRLVPYVTLNLLAGEPAVIKTGTQIGDFVHVDDCGAALAALVDAEVTGSVNIGTGRGTSVADVARAIGAALGREDLVRIESTAARPRVVAEITRLANEVGFSPSYDLERGLGETVDWLRARRLNGPAADTRPGTL
jgi:nucleoside-diphosphate-sugar epimerase